MLLAGGRCGGVVRSTICAIIAERVIWRVFELMLLSSRKELLIFDGSFADNSIKVERLPASLMISRLGKAPAERASSSAS